MSWIKEKLVKCVGFILSVFLLIIVIIISLFDFNDD